MIDIQENLRAQDLKPLFPEFWQLSGNKIRAVQKQFNFSKGSPVYTVKGKYMTRGWTDWTMGFLYGSSLLQFEATGDQKFLEMGLNGILNKMPPHLTHTGVHDHGFNNVSTYGNLRRLLKGGIIPENEWQLKFSELALKCSAAVQAGRWTSTGSLGFIYSFNGPHSLFVDTIRTLRVLALGWILGHRLYGENDRQISLLERLVSHARMTALYSVFYGGGRDIYDIRGRVAHECIFNTNDGNFRCTSSQQGYSNHTTWTRGLAWAITGFAEILEFLQIVPAEELSGIGEKEAIESLFLKAALAASDFYIKYTPTDGLPYWDTGAPGLNNIKNYLDTPADPFNRFEPVDSSAAAIAAQGLLRLSRHMKLKGFGDLGDKYLQAGLVITRSLLQQPYLSSSADHQGLILHSVYHRPNNWDYIPEGHVVPCGESSMWGDYHARELITYLEHMLRNSHLTFWGEETYE
jgi:unsaturated chondroitin disaccharide hydrolase